MNTLIQSDCDNCEFSGFQSEEFPCSDCCNNFPLNFKPKESESTLSELCDVLGWQGGTIHQVIAEVKRLKQVEVSNNKLIDSLMGLVLV